MVTETFSLLNYQKELKDLLSCVVSKLEQYNVSYVALFGTCLGAVRHGDIIPWDDDIDIGVKRDDYLMVKQIIQSECGDLYFWDWYEDPKCCLSFGRIFRRIKEGDSLERKRAYIDLYIIDNVPNGKIARFGMKLLCTVIGRHIVRRCNAKIEYKTYTISSCVIYWLGLVLYLFPVKILRRLHDWIMSCLSRTTGGTLYSVVGGCLTLNALIKENKEIMLGTVCIRIPKDSETYLTSQYGDWRRLPPPGQRGEHAYKADGEIIVAMPDDIKRIVSNEH